MNVSIQKPVYNKYKNFITGLIYGTKLNNSKKHIPIKEMIADIQELIQLTYNPDKIETHNLIATWKIKNKHIKTPVEYWIKKALKKKLPSKTTIEDLSVFFMLKYVLPINAFDLSRKKDASFKIKEKELVFGDNKTWIKKFALENNSPVTKKTKKALIVIEALETTDEKQMTNILKEFKDLLKIFCGGEYKTTVLTKNKPTVQF